jgi:hypothetical protein
MGLDPDFLLGEDGGSVVPVLATEVPIEFRIATAPTTAGK